MATIDRFTLVEVAGSDSGKPAVTAWSPAAFEQPGLLSAPKVLGVTMTDSEPEEPVAVMKFGYLRDVAMQNGETWVVGELLFGKADGSITHTRPAAPLPVILVGTVYEVAAGVCTIAVQVQVIPSLGELSGVGVEAPQDLDVFIYKASTHVWEPRVLDYGNRSTFMHPFLLMGGS